MTSRLTALADNDDVAMGFNRAGADFLKIDVQVGLTFSGIALQTQDSEKRARTRRLAREAYDTVRGFMDKVTLPNNEAQLLARNLLRLKRDLLMLGDLF